MRQVTRQIVNAFVKGETKRIKNTETRDHELYLHDNKIAWFDMSNQVLYMTLAGWPTVTTRERLNGLLTAMCPSHEGFYQRNHKQFFGNEEIASNDVVRVQL